MTIKKYAPWHVAQFMLSHCEALSHSITKIHTYSYLQYKIYAIEWDMKLMSD